MITSRTEVRVGRSEILEAGGFVDEVGVGVGDEFVGKESLHGLRGDAGREDDGGLAITRPNQDQEPWSGKLT